MRVDLERIEVVDDVIAEILRRKTPAERIAIGFSLWTSAQRILTAHLRKSHPDWEAGRVRSEVARRLSHGVV